MGPFLCLSILNPTVVILVDEQTTLSWTNTSVVLLGAFARLMFLVVMCARSLDERSFMLKVISKLMTSILACIATEKICGFPLDHNLHVVIDRFDQEAAKGS